MMGFFRTKGTLDQVAEQLNDLPVPMQLVLPSGQVLGPQQASLSLKIHDKPTLLSLAQGNLGALGEAFVEGRAQFTGKVRDLMAAAVAWLRQDPTQAQAYERWWLKMLAHWHSLRAHTLSRDAAQIQFHYDLSDEFFALWLDPKRVYSCAYFAQPNFNLDQAQEAKLDLICRKLHLQKGERFLDVGCGWGGLLLWAAQHYGVQAVGITLSKNQFEHVRTQIEKQGLQNQVSVQLLDYRALKPSQPFDKIASIGMFEHVGRARLADYFQTLHGLLRPGGWVLNHGITAGGLDNHQLGAGMGDFIEKYIFPGGELVPIQEVLRAVAQGGLEAVDVENLRPHYAKTLWAWSDRLEGQLGAALSVLSQRMSADQAARVLRAYRLYLAGCAVGFEQGWTLLYQVLAIRPEGKAAHAHAHADLNAYPFVRNFMYEPGRV
jgi:cyclopropane-fatty-acyl-phospholipid synthase